MTGQILKRDRLAAFGDSFVVASPLWLDQAHRHQRLHPAAAPALEAGPTRAVDVERAQLSRLHEELETLRSQAMQEGRAEGLKLGSRAAEDRAARLVAQQLAALRALAQGLDNAVATLQSRDTDRMADVVFAAICRLVGSIWGTRDGAMAAVKAVLSEAGLNGPLTVQVSASDLDRLTTMAHAFPDLQLGHVRFVAHPEVAVGGCRVEYPEGLLDARLETQLALLQHALQEAWAGTTGQLA